MVSTGAGVPVPVVVHTPVVFSGFPVVAKVFTFAAITIAVDVLSAFFFPNGISNIPGCP
jgi:hypothetical protein